MARSFADKPWNDVEVSGVTYDGTSTDYGYILGLTKKPTPQLDIGLSYRSAIQHKSKGSVKFEPIGDGAREYTAATVNNQPVAAADGSNLASGASLELTSPSVWNLGVGYTYDAKNKIYFNASYTDWSVVKDLVLKTDVDVWQDPTAIAREAEYYVSRTDLNYQDHVTLLSDWSISMTH